jgi:hypothetical protein
MRIITIVLALLMATTCFADVKLFKFEKDGKVVGVCYSDKDGNTVPPVGVTAVQITEGEKDATIAQQKSDAPIVVSYPLLIVLMVSLPAQRLSH